MCSSDLRFCAGRSFREKAAELGGYDVEDFGVVHFNGARGRPLDDRGGGFFMLRGYLLEGPLADERS